MLCEIPVPNDAFYLAKRIGFRAPILRVGAPLQARPDKLCHADTGCESLLPQVLM